MKNHHSNKNPQDIELSKKIDIQKSHHSYRTFFNRKYSWQIKNSYRFLKYFLEILFGMLLLIGLFVGVVLVTFGHDLPDVSKLKTMNFAETTRIYDRNGDVLYNIYNEENRNYVSLKNISKYAINATIAIEDKNFYSHPGFDLFGIIRAQLKNLQEDSIKEGASTITQQLAKNVFLSSERTYDRKVKELILALEIEFNFSKDEILEMYLNKISYGNNAFGIQAAAETYFNKSAKDLDLAEAAILASLPKTPSYYNPYGSNKNDLMGYCKSDDQSQDLGDDGVNPADLSPEEEAQMLKDLAAQAAKDAKCTSMDSANYVMGRKDYVLLRMLEDKYITKDLLQKAWEEANKIKFADPKQQIKDPHFVFYVKQLLEAKYGKDLVESGGLEVKTTIDPKLQAIAEKAVSDHVDQNNKYGANNAGALIINPKNGEILAMVGSINFWNKDINGQVNVTTSPRQPGSSFKPLIYAAAINNAGIGSGTVLGDYRTVFNKKDTPQDYDGGYLGRITIRQALGGSRNIPAVKAFFVAGGEDSVLDFLEKLGVTYLREFKNKFNEKAKEHGWTFSYGWPMAIGSGELPLLDLAQAYSVFANAGQRADVNPLLEVKDRGGKVIDAFYTTKTEPVLDPQVAYIITDMLADEKVRPAGSWRNLLTIPGQNVAAKTGTSNKLVGKSKISLPNNDVTIGYTPSYVVAVWVGNSDGSPLKNSAYSLYTSDPIWHQIFADILKDKPAENFPVPPGLQYIGKEIYPSGAQFKDWDKMFRQSLPAITQQTTN